MRESRRLNERYPSIKPVRLVLKAQINGPQIAGPSPGTFCNISSSGACLVVRRVVFGEYHLVYTPQEDESKVLELEVDDMAILCRPVWFHKFVEDELEQYRIGIKFEDEKVLLNS